MNVRLIDIIILTLTAVVFNIVCRKVCRECNMNGIEIELLFGKFYAVYKTVAHNGMSAESRIVQ